MGCGMQVTSKTNVRRFALEVAQKQGRKQFTRVSEDFLGRIEARTKAIIYSEIERHPSLGKTLK